MCLKLNGIFRHTLNLTIIHFLLEVAWDTCTITTTIQLVFEFIDILCSYTKAICQGLIASQCDIKKNNSIIPKKQLVNTLITLWM